jgi:hypothetical protein
MSCGMASMGGRCSMRHRPAVVPALLALIALVLLPAISNVEANALPAQWAPYLWIAWPVGLLLAAPLVYLEIRQWRQGPRSGSERGPASADDERLVIAYSPQREKAPPAAMFSMRGDIPNFVGRREELRVLLDSMLAAADRPAGGIVVYTVDGMAGVGKTTFSEPFRVTDCRVV